MEADTIKLLQRKLACEDGWHQIGSLTIHFSEACNLRCHYCSYAGQHDRLTIAPVTLERALAHEPIDTCIVGGGEPTMVDSRQVTFASLMARFPRPHSAYMITNGTLVPLDIDKVADRFDFIRLSLDAATPETYIRLKGVDYFRDVVQNIHKYLQAGVAQVGVSFVVQKLNLHEIPAVIELLAPVFYAYPRRFFLKFKNLRAAPDFLPPAEALDEVFAEVCELRDSSPLLGTFLELSTNYQDIPRFHENTDHQMPQAERCYYSLLYCLVRTNGDVYPCGLMSRKEINRLGNILHDSWETICERQWEFSISQDGAGHSDCAGCWDDRKNLVIQEILDTGITADPSLTRLGGIGGFYCRW